MTINEAASSKAILWFATYIKCMGANEREAALYALDRHHRILAWLAKRNDNRAARLEAVNAKLVEALQDASLALYDAMDGDLTALEARHTYDAIQPVIAEAKGGER